MLRHKWQKQRWRIIVKSTCHLTATTTAAAAAAAAAVVASSRYYCSATTAARPSRPETRTWFAFLLAVALPRSQHHIRPLILDLPACAHLGSHHCSSPSRPRLGLATPYIWCRLAGQPCGIKVPALANLPGRRNTSLLAR